MTTLDQRTIRLLDDLIELGDRVKGTFRREEYSGVVAESGLHAEWVSRVCAFVERIFGRDSEYYRRINSAKMDETYSYSVGYLYHHLLAIKADIQAGALFNSVQIVEADVFDEILEQAEHLCTSGYYAPAAVVTGCVLEDALRRLAQRKGIVLSQKPKLDAVNAELAKVGTYQKLMQKRITALADIRNSAAHGQWNDFTKEDVDAMIRDVRDFLLRFFT
ncbi:MAG: DUF4145 domain-containing protein [Mesorhizobium sp.]